MKKKFVLGRILQYWEDRSKTPKLKRDGVARVLLNQNGNKWWVFVNAGTMVRVT
jgi:hypothetical protein